MSLTKLSIAELINGYHTKQFLPSEVVKSYIANIENNSKLNAFITTNFEEAIAQAKIADSKIDSGEIGELTGIPIANKDLFCTKGVRTTCASKMLENFVPEYESTVTQKLLDAGAISLGKLNMDEFAMGSTNITSYFGPVINPYKAQDSSEDLVPGGSSGGSATAVAAHLCAGATGSDTGGSIRQPASFTNTVGIKPTYGRCSRYGMIAFASSLDQAGVFARNVYDTALMQKVVAGFDEKDSTSVNIAVPNYNGNLNGNLKGLKIGIAKEYQIEGINKEIANLWDKTTAMLKDAGAEIVNISLPHTSSAAAVYYVLATAECSSNLARYDGVRYGHRLEQDFSSIEEFYSKNRASGFGREVKRRILTGTFVLSSGSYEAYYQKAQKVRTLVALDFSDAFNNVDAILSPATPSSAFPIADSQNINKQDPLKMYLNDAFTIPANLAGLPAISVPSGFDSKNLPLGMQLIGRKFDEQTILNIALAIESRRGF